MAQDTFIARCHPHVLGIDGKMDHAECDALASDMAELKGLGVVLTLVANYAVGPYRFTNLKDALAQARAGRLESAS